MRLMNSLGGAGCPPKSFARRAGRDGPCCDGASISGLRHSKARHCVLTAAAAVVVVAMAGSAAADTKSGQTEIVSMSVPEIRVASNGNEYTDTAETLPPIKGVASLELDPSNGGWIKSWKMWPILIQIQGSTTPFYDYGSAKTYPVGDRPQLVEGTAAFNVPHSLWKSHVVAACNIHANNLRKQGMSDSQIFANERTVTLEMRTAVTFERYAGGIGTVPPPEAWTPHDRGKFDVICERDPNALTAADLEPELHPIEDVALSVNVTQTSMTSCSLNLRGAITAREASENNRTFRFRYVADSGELSGVKSVFLPEHEKTVEFEHSFPAIFEEAKSGKIRIVGVDPMFDSDDVVYQTCDQQSQTVEALLPPQPTNLDLAVRREMMIDGMACPVEFKATGMLKGRGKAAGEVTLGVGAGGGTAQVAEMPFDVDDDEFVMVSGMYQLSWQSATSSGRFVQLALSVYNAGGQKVDSLTDSFPVACRSATPMDFEIVSPGGRLPGGVDQREIRLSGGLEGAEYNLRFFYRRPDSVYEPLSSDELPDSMSGQTKSFALSALSGSRFWRLQVCLPGQGQFACKVSSFQLPLRTPVDPDAPKIGFLAAGDHKEAVHNGMACPTVVRIKAEITNTGDAATGTAFLYSQNGQVTQHPYSLEAGADSGNIGGIDTFIVEALHDFSWQGVGGSQQTLDYRMVLQDAGGNVIHSKSQSQLMTCRDLDTLDFTVEAPKGQLAAGETGEIRLSSGGLYNGDYNLHFFRKLGESQIAPAQSVSLPKTMSGTSQTFPLAALTGGPFWQLRVCPVGQIAAACRTSDFQLPAPKIAGLESRVLRNAVRNGMTCPVEIEIVGLLAGDGIDASGTAILATGAGQMAPEPYSVTAAGSYRVARPHQLFWNNTEADAQQGVQFHLSVLDADGNEIASQSGSEVFHCHKTGQAQAGNNSKGSNFGPTTPDPASRGGLALGGIGTEAAPGHRQQGQRQRGRTQVPVVGQIATAPVSFAILAPKGRLRPGPRAEIRLSGMVPEGGYTLRFYRKDKGRYRLVRLAGLPQSMDGNRRLLRLSTLRSATDWRLEVCPAGADRRACKTSDFTLARARGAGAGQGGQEPEIRIITPGAIKVN